MLACVEKVIAERDWGVILSVRDVDQPGEKFQVKALTKILLGRPSVGETWCFEGEYRQSPTVWPATRWHGPATARRPQESSSAATWPSTLRASGGSGPRGSGTRWGVDLASIISDENNIPEIATVLAPERPNLAVRLAAAVVRVWKDSAAESNLVDWLMQRGVEDLKISRRVARILGDSAIDALSSNPYILVPLLPSWKKLDELARRVMQEAGTKAPRTDVRRLVGAVDAVVKDALADGDTVLTRELPPKSPGKTSGVL